VTLRVVVADDELLARHRLQRLLAAIPDVEVIAQCTRANEALAYPQIADVLLLDVEMPGLSGIDLLRRWPSDGASVILCTAHAEHGLAAFDGGAVDYLLKPVDPERLALAIARVRKRRASRPQMPEPLPIPTANGIVLVPPDALSHAMLDGELVELYATSGRYFSTQPLAELHARLPQERFVRVHRRAFINLACVDRFDPVASGGFLARMKDGSLVPVSRQAARWLRRRWRTT
jgi:two-component system LytT family response regulator